MEITDLTYDIFGEFISGENKTVLLDFYAKWCLPCKNMMKFVEEFAGNHPEISVGRIDAEEEWELSEKFDISSVPALVIVKNGEVVKKTIGGKDTEEIEAMFSGIESEK